MDTKNFKTKTVFKMRDNGDSGSKWCVALDVGYSAVKVFSPNIYAEFASYAKKEPANFIGKIGGNVILYQDLETGETWTVGETAQDRIDISDANETEAGLYNRQRYNSPMFLVLCRTGIGISCLNLASNAPNGRELFVQTGLPPRYLKSDQEMMKNVIRGRHHFSLQLGSGEKMEFDLYIKPENIDVISQPRGTLYSVAVGNDHQLTENAESLLNSSVVVFDAGFGTLDIFPLMANHVEESQTFDNLGMKRVFQETVAEINRRYDQDLTVPVFQKYLTTGAFRYQKRDPEGRMITKDIPFDDILKEKNYQVCMEAVDKLEQVVPMAGYNYLIITGGTSAAWNQIIRDRFKTSSTLTIIAGNRNDSISMAFANVRGYFMYRCNIIENGE